MDIELVDENELELWDELDEDESADDCDEELDEKELDVELLES